MFKKEHRRNGFTIIELMVAIAIFSILIGGVLWLNIRAFQSYYTVGALNEISNNGSFALDELTGELRESRMGTVLISQLQDPAAGQWHDILIFASARGPYDSVPANDKSYFHRDADGNPDWQSAVCYYPFTTQTATGQLNQLHRYVCYDATLTDNDFPLSVSITASAISLSKQDGSALASFDRANDAERILANHLSTEDGDGDLTLDANENDGVLNLPMDNADGALDTGIDYTVNNNVISIKLFLQKPIAAIGGLVKRRVSITLNSDIALRN